MQPDRPRTPRTLSGSLLEFLHEPFALGADFINQLSVRGELLTQGYRPRLRIGLGIVHRHLDLEVSEVGPPDSLTHFRGTCDHAAAPVDPQVVAKSDAVDHQRVTVPGGRRVTLPRRVRSLRQLPAV